MQSWIFGIVGIVFVGVLIEIILPEGKTSAFIKHIFSVFVLYVIISPLPNLLNANINVSNNDSTVIDENFIYSVNLQKIEQYEKTIINNLSDIGFKDIDVVISADVFSEQLIIQKVYVDIVSVKIENSAKNINLNAKIYEIVSNLLNVEQKDILIYG